MNTEKNTPACSLGYCYYDRVTTVGYSIKNKNIIRTNIIDRHMFPWTDYYYTKYVLVFVVAVVVVVAVAVSTLLYT